VGGLWGGDGFMLQRLDGEGRAWIELSGELVHYTLNPGQTLMVHPGHVGMFEGQRAVPDHPRPPASPTCCFGQDGYHLVALTGPGQIWLQSHAAGQPGPRPWPPTGPSRAADSAGTSAAAGTVGGILGNIMRS